MSEDLLFPSKVLLKPSLQDGRERAPMPPRLNHYQVYWCGTHNYGGYRCIHCEAEFTELCNGGD